MAQEEREDAPQLLGFARLTPEQRRALGSKGGRTAHERGTANKFTPDIASRAGKIPHQRGTAHHWTSEQAREAGRKGGVAARTTRSKRSTTTAGEGVVADESESEPPAIEHEEPPHG
jgi:general stress protein YciG